MHYLASTRTRHHCRPDQGQPRSAEGPSPLAKAPFGLTDTPVGRPIMAHRGRTTGQGENVACQSARDPEAQGQALDLTGGGRIAKLLLSGHANHHPFARRARNSPASARAGACLRRAARSECGKLWRRTGCPGLPARIGVFGATGKTGSRHYGPLTAGLRRMGQTLRSWT
jgi:hypothetical protein